jgi:SAM-dependent methyltransferase
MSGFDPGWLLLRETYDALARENAGLTPDFAAALPPGSPLIMDLGCGTGSNLRYLLLRLGRMGQRWLCIDADAALLDRVPRMFPPFVEQVAAVQHDLNDLDPVDVSAVDAVACTALLDLCSLPWMERLADKLAAARKPFLATLTVDGRVSFEPEDPDDGFVLDLFRRHMTTDKGFGPAMGPGAAQAMAGLLEARGFRVRTARSDWDFREEDGMIQHVLIHGYASAAMELAPEADGRIAAWADRRHARIGGQVVGHLDLLALPA